MDEGLLTTILAGIVLTFLFVRLSLLERRMDRLSRIDAKLDALLKASGVTFDPFQDVPPDVRAAIEQGQKIVAIKRLRQATGLGLKEAKDIVDEVQRRRAPAIEPR